MRTLILPPRSGEDAQALWNAALAEGWRTVRFPGWKPPKNFVAKGDLALYGEPLFAAAVAEKLDLALLEPTLDWLAQVPRPLLGRRVIATRLGDARQYAGAAFVKPADDKSFPAKVYRVGSELPDEDALPDDTPVYVSDPVDFDLEARCFIENGEPVAVSTYARRGEPYTTGTTAEIEGARGFAKQIIRACPLPPAVALDVGYTATGWAVVEANPVFSASIYACDPVKVLDVVARACVKKPALTAADRPWIVSR